MRAGVAVDTKALNFTNSWDPPLTPKGWIQAAKTGEYLKKLLIDEGKYKIENIIFEVSPFVRCVQTASEITSKLGINKVQITYLASETQYQDERCDYSESPIPNVDSWSVFNGSSSAMTMDDYKQKYNIRQDLEIKDQQLYKNESTTLFPESD